MTDEQRQMIFGTAVWLELFAKRFGDEWPETAQQALARAKSLKHIVEEQK